MALIAYPPATFDIVIDNLASAEWVGATGIRSKNYFSRIDRVLKPHGVFVFGKNFARRRDALLATIAAVFPYVSEHLTGQVVVAGHGPVSFNRDTAEAVLAPRAEFLELKQQPYSDWLFTGWQTIRPQDLAKPTVIDESFLGTLEYRLDPM